MEYTMRVDRSEMPAGLAVGGCGVREQEPAGLDPSLYSPKAHLVEDRKFLRDYTDQYPLVDLITSSPTLESRISRQS